MTSALATPSSFEALRREDAVGEWWSARDLQIPLGYDRWERFDDAVQRAELSASHLGEDAPDHFRSAAKKVEIGQGAERIIADYRLTPASRTDRRGAHYRKEVYRVTSTLVLSQAALVGLLNRSIPFAGRDDMLPVLASVELEADGFGYLTATATDRYRLGHARTKLEAQWATDVEPFKFLMRLRDAREVVKLFSPARTRSRSVIPSDATLTFDGGEKPTLTIAGPGVRNDGSRLSVTFEPTDGEFVKWRKLLAPVVNAERTPAPFAVNPHYLADFAAVTKKNAPLRITASAPDKPLLIEAEDFVGILMPVRTGSAWPFGFEVLTGDEIRIGVVLTPPKIARARKQVAT